MQLPTLIRATLIKRYKRLLADVTLLDGQEMTVYCPNTGAMTGCAEPGSIIWLSKSKNVKRKHRYTWELVETPGNSLASIHSVNANMLAYEAIEAGVIVELTGYDDIVREAKYGQENSRIDLLLVNSNTQEKCFVEVKSVTLLANDNGLGVFPDAVSERARKHLRELIYMKQQGHRAVLLFCVQHTGIKDVAPADLIDSKYADTFREAITQGVEMLAYSAVISLECIRLKKRLPLHERQLL